MKNPSEGLYSSDPQIQLLRAKLAEVFPDIVLVAIIRTVDEDLAKQFDPELSEEPEYIQENLNQMRLNAIMALQEYIELLQIDNEWKWGTEQ